MKTLLSPRELAAAIGASESSLKRWTDDGLIVATRTAGGHRRISLAEAIRFIRETAQPVVRPEILGLGDIEMMPKVALEAPVDRATALYDAVTSGEVSKGRGLIVSMFLGGESVAAICDGPVKQAMQRVGELWKHDASGIYIEHRATDIVIHALNTLRMLLASPDGAAPVAIGGAPAADPYLIPSLTCATCLASVGFREINLGADTPIEAMARAAEHFEAKLVWLAISATATTPPDLGQQLDALARRLEGRNVPIVVGGRALPRDVTAGQRENVHVAASMTELVGWARALLEPASAK
jgi:excisionase family DNA binding protein